MPNRNFLLFILLVFCSSSFAQTVLLEVDRKKEQRISTFGPNLGRFSHPYVRLGFLASNDFEGGRIKYGSSVNAAFGVRQKYKVSALYSLGFETEIQYT